MFLDVIVSIAACSVFMVNTFGEETEVNTEIMQRRKKKMQDAVFSEAVCLFSLHELTSATAS